MRTVALIDFHTAGHHYAFIRLFAKYLIVNKYRVCIIYPEKTADIKKYLLDQGASADAVICHEACLAKKKISNFGRLNEAIAAAILWKQTESVLLKCSRIHRLKFDFVFFGWLDDYLSNNLHHWIVDFLFPFRWSGLYFHPWYLYQTQSSRVSFSSIDSVLRSANCLSVAVHDEFIVNQLRERLKKRILLFPEMADSTPPDNQYAVAREIDKRAGGRLKIGLIGCEKRKGILPFIQLVERADSSKYFFFLAGPLPASDFRELEQKILLDFLERGRDNFFYFPYYLEEGAKINGVISALDVIYLVYENFRSSSNFSTKAVLFKKRVIATEKYWIGGVTMKYKLGVTVPEGDVIAMLAALDKLAYEIQKDVNLPDFQSYLSAHQEQNLEYLFAQSFLYPQ